MSVTRNDILKKLQEKLNPFIKDYEAHTKDTRDKFILTRPFFDMGHYVLKGHGQTGYQLRLKLLDEASKCTDLEQLRQTIKRYYFDRWHTGSNTRKAIEDTYIEAYAITQDTIDLFAKKISAKDDVVYRSRTDYLESFYQEPARRDVTEMILKMDSQILARIMQNNDFSKLFISVYEPQFAPN